MRDFDSMYNECTMFVHFNTQTGGGGVLFNVKI